MMIRLPTSSQTVELDDKAAAAPSTMKRHDHKHKPNIFLVHGAFADGSIWTQFHVA
jgi:hypothetical protein